MSTLHATLAELVERASREAYTAGGLRFDEWLDIREAEQGGEWSADDRAWLLASQTDRGLTGREERLRVTVERILAACEQALRDQIAGQIEAHGALWDRSPDWRGGVDEAADIARGTVR